MISFSDEELSLNGKPSTITEWQVWFQTPFGLMQSFREAVQKCKENELDPDLVIQPVPVARDQIGRYEVVMR